MSGTLSFQTIKSNGYPLDITDVLEIAAATFQYEDGTKATHTFGQTPDGVRLALEEDGTWVVLASNEKLPPKYWTRWFVVRSGRPAGEVIDREIRVVEAQSSMHAIAKCGDMIEPDYEFTFAEEFESLEDAQKAASN